MFWAFRGGGGGTFSVVTKFTYKLHYPSSLFDCSYPFVQTDHTEIGQTVLKKIVSVLRNLSTQWGGFLIGAGTPNADLSWGIIFLYMVHYGPYNASTKRL